MSGLAGVPCEAWIFRAMLRGSRLRPGRVRRADGSCGTSVGLESAADAGLHTVFALILLLRREKLLAKEQPRSRGGRDEAFQNEQ